MWDLPRPGLEPVCPALAGRFSTTAPPGKPDALLLKSTELSRRNRIQESSRERPTGLDVQLVAGRTSYRTTMIRGQSMNQFARG